MSPAPEGTGAAPDAGATAPGDLAPGDLAAAGVPSREVVFHRVARSGQIPDGHIRRFFAGDLECALARLNGTVYATSNYCTHLDCLLSSGKIIDDGIRCSCHGSVFDLETGDPLYPPATQPIAVYPVREEDGEVYVGISEADLIAGGPRRRRPRRD